MRYLPIAVILYAVSVSSPLFAFPFPMQDARTAALGGAGVAIDVRNAPFANPALMATSDENYDWIVMLPSRGEVVTESSKFEDDLKQFQADAPVLLSDLPAAQLRLDAMADNTRLESRFNTITIVVPNETISAVAFYKKIEFESARIKVGSVGQGSDPNNDFNSFVEHRAVTVQEQGVSLAKLLHDPILIPFDDVMFGVNIKLSLIQAYGYDEAVYSNDGIGGGFALDRNQVVDRTGAANFDLGFAKEYGVWKVGLVVKDIFSFKHEYGESEEFYQVKPLVRAGFAYRSRKTLWEIDADISHNEPVAHYGDTKYIATGFEHELFPGFFIRLGANKNTVGDKRLTRTAGVGLNYFGFEINVATLQNSEEKGGFAQLIMEF